MRRSARRRSGSARHRGTMVVHTNVKSSPPKLGRATQRTKHSDGSDTHRRRRRMSEVAKQSSNVRAYSVLINVLFLLSFVYPEKTTFLDYAFEYLASLTSVKRHSDDTIRTNLEGAFRMIAPEIDHLFLPWIRTVHVNGRATEQLDAGFMVDTLSELSIGRGTQAKELLRQIATQLDVPPKPRRRTY